MPVQWSGLAPELLLRLNRADAEPLRAQLERELRTAIRSGQLAAGERLPSSRELARELGISRGLVQECYRQLVAEGFLSARSGSATRVASGAVEESPRPAGAPQAEPRLTVDFTLGIPDLAGFPRRDWMWALREAARRAPAEAFGYGDPRGSLRLREVIAAYVRRVRGAVVGPERIVVCAGVSQGLNLACRALAAGGIRGIAFEDPGRADDRAAAERLGLDARSVAVDERGIDVGALAATGARAVVVTPAHQFPTGVVLAPERRRLLVEWAEAHDATIVEDDYDSEFRYDREPVGALQGLASSRVALIGTVSKSLAPGLRLGWILCPASLLDAIVEEKRREDQGCPVLDQLALATLIESGRYDRHLRRMRAVYRGRRQALIDALARHAPAVELPGLAAGIHAVARLPERIDEAAVVEAARARSVGLHPMSAYRVDGRARPPALVLGFGNVGESSIERGIEAVADLLGAAGPVTGS
jgi:GntR family transcriptional regulator / MocR family aminotransferase